jgi:hypothetical protein
MIIVLNKIFVICKEEAIQQGERSFSLIDKKQVCAKIFTAALFD